jgi:hypothetical protein
MIRRIKLAEGIATLLVIFLPSFTLAQDVNFSVSPSVVKIANLTPGESTEFDLTIHNKNEIAHIFTITTFQPPEEERREGRAEFPNDSWINFSSLLACLILQTTLELELPFSGLITIKLYS